MNDSSGFDQVEKLARRRLTEDEGADGLRQPRVLPQLRDVVGILEEPGVEDEVGLERHAELEPETQQLDRHPVRVEVPEPDEQPLPEVPQRQIRRVQDHVRVRSHGSSSRRSSWMAAAIPRLSPSGWR